MEPRREAHAALPPSADARPMISVVVCTHNRAARLDRCLRHMSEAAVLSASGSELIVVDNGSDDDTRRVVARRADSLPLTYVFEDRRGLSHARNRGIAEARGPIIAFTDDDCLVAPDWASTIVTEFADRPGLSVLGGRVELADAGDYPVSLRTHAEPAHIGSVEQIMSKMSGCNMAFRRDVFEQIGCFDPAFGKGRRIGSAEDIDLLYRALKRGSRILYLPHVLVRHAHGRDTATAIDDVECEYVKGRGAFYCKFIGDRQIARIAYWEVSRLLGQCLRGTESAKLLRSLAAGALYQSLNFVRGAARGVQRLVS